MSKKYNLVSSEHAFLLNPPIDNKTLRRFIIDIDASNSKLQPLIVYHHLRQWFLLLIKACENSADTRV